MQSLRCPLLTGLSVVVLTLLAGPAAAQSRPNVVLIMSDDMGYSDLGSFGAEIDTPNLDQLASDGLRYTSFYNAGRCCPTRASLITGLHPHQTGMGNMMNSSYEPETQNRGVPGYQGHITHQSVTLAEVLGEAGYYTVHSGKWHLGQHEKSARPWNRGFDDSYGHLSGATNYFDPEHPRGIWLNGEPIEDPESTTDKRYYTTDAFTDHAIRFLQKNEQQEQQRPFFLYLAYNAPHWPLHAHESDVEKYRGRYMEGWGEIRRKRYERLKEMGVIDDDVALSPQDGRPFEKLSKQKQREMDRRMAIYAAQIDRMDHNIGKLMRYLKRTGQFDNTLILFLHDNGGSHEGGELGGGTPQELNNAQYGRLQSYGYAWANASNTPLRRYKSYLHEGGIATPLVAHWPEGIDRDQAGTFRRQVSYVVDIMPTLTEITGAEYPERAHGENIPSMEGVSLAPSFNDADADLAREKPLFWEHNGNRAIRDGKWKLVSVGNKLDYGGEDSWALYNLASDRSELNNLADEYPQRVDRLSERWWQWARRAQVVPNGMRRQYSDKTRFELEHGDTLDREEAPFLFNQPFHVEARLDGAVSDGVVVAQGGQSDGFAVYVQDGRLYLALRHSGELTTLKSDSALRDGTRRIAATIRADGTATLSVDGKRVARKQTPGPLSTMPFEGLQVGQDASSRVGPYDGPNRYDGSLRNVIVRLHNEPRP